MKDFDYLNLRTDKYLILGYPLDSDNINYDNISKIDDSFIYFNSNELNNLLDTKVKEHILFFNKYSNIAGKPIRSFVNKIKFQSKDYEKLCEIFKNYRTSDKTEQRIYDCLNEIFSNKNKEFDNWIKNYIEDQNIDICLSFYDSKYQSGTAGISFGYSENQQFPLIVFDGATEHIESEKIPIKVGTLNKEFKGISSIDFTLQPVNFVKDWIFINNFARFEPNSFTVSYNAYSRNCDKNGFTFIEFKFIPIEGQTFYKNKVEFDECNEFFRWIINASKNRVSKEDIRNKIPSIKMKLKSIEVTNNSVRQNEKSASEFIEDLFVNLNFISHYIESQITKTIENENKTAKIEFSNINNSYCDCELKAYL